jgi:hypothetical protein
LDQIWSFHDNIKNSQSSVFQLFYSLYSTPLSTIISQCGAHHHLYEDDTQLFISFTSSEFVRNIAILESTITKVCSWISANLLLLNSSKTDFLLIGLSKQLSKLDNPTVNVTSDVTLSPVPQARNLGVLFDSNLSHSGHISSILNLVFLILGTTGVLDLFLIKLQLVILQLILSILNLTTVTLCFSIFLQINWIIFSLLLILLLVVTKTPRFHQLPYFFSVTGLCMLDMNGHLNFQQARPLQSLKPPDFIICY